MTLAELTRGFADPVHGAQRSFRVLLDAMSRPGRVHVLPPQAIDGVEPPAPIGIGVAAALLTLLDAETSVRLAGAFASDTVRSWLRFHCGVREAAPELAAFTVIDAGRADATLWSTLDAGSDEAPQAGATLIVEVPSLVADPSGLALQLRGAGIASVHRLAAAGLSPEFWRARIALQALAPRGIDLVLASGTRIAAIPRSTRITIEE